MSKLASALLALFVLAAAPLAAPRVASACGGCFAPTGTPNIVTQHRMAVSLSARETTLWDQIQYAGAPEDFVWVLPVSAGVAIELADNAFFEALAAGTQINMTAPLPPLPCFCGDSGFGCGMSAADTSARGGFPPSFEGDGGVTVFHEGNIGPYETATVQSDDPMALVAWLQERGYGVPDQILPTIARYSELGLAFAVLRLRPSVGVQQMQPVRVTVPGLAPTFPLRMVAAGATEELGLELYVFAEGRSQTMNMETLELDRDAITFDWATGTFDYDARFSDAIRRAGGRAWVAEYAGAVPAITWSYSSVDPADGTTHTPEDDLTRVRRGLPSRLVVTKLRTRISPNLLDRDLVLGAAYTEAAIDTQINVTRELNRASDSDCDAVCGDGPSEFEGCSVHDEAHLPRRDRGLPLALALLAAPVSLWLRRRGRRR
jgi:hypothetical protein